MHGALSQPACISIIAPYLIQTAIVVMADALESCEQ